METRAHHILIGLFTVIALGSALLFALWLGKSHVDTEFKLYDVLFNEPVSGLSVGSHVQYSGIAVGDVQALRLDPQDPRRVIARIRVSGTTPIKQDTHARLALTSITGSAAIQLFGGSPNSPPLLTQNDNPTQITAEPSPLARLLNNGEDLVSNINQLLLNANRMFSDQNIERMSQTMAHLEEMTGSVAERRDEIREALSNLAAASRQANEMLTQGTSTLRNANSLVDQQGRSAMNSAARAMASLEDSSRNIEQLIERNQDALSGGMQGLSELGPAIGELRSTLAALRQMTRQLSDNPGALLLDHQQNKEFQP